MVVNKKVIFSHYDIFIWQEITRPYLAMRMRVGASHHRPAVLEDLHPTESSAQLGRQSTPLVHDVDDIFRLHQRQRQVSPRVEAHDLAVAACCGSAQKRMPLQRWQRRWWCVLQQRRKIVVKDGRRVIIFLMGRWKVKFENNVFSCKKKYISTSAITTNLWDR